MLRRPNPIILPPALQKLDNVYTTLSSRGRDAWFYRVRGAEGSAILPLLATGAADGARGPTARLHASVASNTRIVTFPRRSASVLAAAVEEAQAKGRRIVWLPLQLMAVDDIHANAVWMDCESHTVVLFEPHGSDAQSEAQRGCSFMNYYVSAEYFQAFRVLVNAALPGWHVVVPSDYEPAVFGQSLSEVRGLGAGDSWCVLWTLLFLREMTVHGSWTHFITEVMGRRANGTLRAWVIDRLEHQAWMSTVIDTPIVLAGGSTRAGRHA